MGNLYFRHGAMGASKTANMLMTRFDYIDKGLKVALLKPKEENRDGEMTIKSRIGLEAECEYAEDFIEKFCKSPFELDAIFIDEAQFLSAKYVDYLAYFSDIYNIPVFCYGLRTDFQSHFFEGSKRLFEIADVIEEIPTICWCGNKAIMNGRIYNGKIIYVGEQIQLGKDYVSLCRKHYLEGKIKK